MEEHIGDDLVEPVKPTKILEILVRIFVFITFFGIWIYIIFM